MFSAYALPAWKRRHLKRCRACSVPNQHAIAASCKCCRATRFAWLRAGRPLCPRGRSRPRRSCRAGAFGRDLPPRQPCEPATLASMTRSQEFSLPQTFGTFGALVPRACSWDTDATRHDSRQRAAPTRNPRPLGPCLRGGGTPCRPTGSTSPIASSFCPRYGWTNLVRSIGTSTTSGTRPDTSGGCLGPRSIPPPSHFSCDPERAGGAVRVPSSLEPTRAVFGRSTGYWREYAVSARIAATKVETVRVSAVSLRRWTISTTSDCRTRSAPVSPSRRGDTWRQTTTYREMDMGFCPEQAEAEIRVWYDAKHCASAFGLPGASRSIR